MCGVPYWIPLFLCVISTSSAIQDKFSAGEIVTGVLDKCLSRNHIGKCLQEEAANAMGRALNLDEISLGAGITLQRTAEKEIEGAKSFSSQEYQNKSAYDTFWDNMQRFLSTRSISIQLGDEQEEGRGKRKKIMRYIGVAIATAAAILVPIKLKLIAWMAATALMIGKIALVLASLVGLKTLVSKPQEETTHVHYDGHRSDQAHYLAYSGHELPPGNSIEY